MATVEEFLLQGGEEKYKDAMKFNDTDSKQDPESEPYKSKYKARELYHELMTAIEDNAQRNSNDDKSWLFLQGALNLRLGSNYSETDELSTGEELLGKCVDQLDKVRLDPKAFSVVQRALNELGILWTGRRQPAKAKEYLEKARELYILYKRDVDGAPFTVDDLFKVLGEGDDISDIVQKRTESFENTFTHTMYYLAQVNAQLGENDTAAAYCHETLSRQLKSKKYDPLDWAMNAATLSQFYITNEDFPLARHCLASAHFILQEYGEKPESLLVQPQQTESNEDLVEREKLPKSWADLFRCYTKYGLALLEHSRDHLYAELDREEQESENQNAQEPTIQTNSAEAEQNDEGKNKNKLFDLELTSIEEQITKERVLDFEGARGVFLTVQKWLNTAKDFYTLDGHCTDYVEIIQDHSKLYKLLAFFEGDLERQCRMQKRRVDLLQGTLKELNAQFYLLICRQLQYELAETLSSMLDNKMAIIEATEEPPTQHAVHKINTLCKQSIEQFQGYVDSLKDSKTKVAPEKYAEEDERPALIAHFCMGRLHSKFLVFDARSKLANMNNSLKEFQALVDYCKRNPSATSKVATEKELCEEMIALLPAKMDKIRAQAE